MSSDLGLVTGNTGSAGNITPLINAAVYLRTDPSTPPLRGWTMDFDYCPCTVHWRNETTGAPGTAKPTPTCCRCRPVRTRSPLPSPSTGKYHAAVGRPHLARRVNER
ncbi:hypothetical protein [Rhodococcus sp. YH1]|uniref:hypothetical protein n=1 Tax=Rhodococcus sp. YH1 TaxID=89066 RepID=UPI001EE45B25